MPKKLEMICDSCLYGETKIVDGVTHSLNSHKFKRLQTTCLKTMSVVNKWRTYKDSRDCGYRPKSGQIGKKLYQKQLGEK